MAAEKKNTALATVDTFQIVTGMEGLDEELLAELEDEMDDLDAVKGISCRHIKIPSGGGKAYEVESDDPDDPDIEKEIEAVIIFLAARLLLCVTPTDIFMIRKESSLTL